MFQLKIVKGAELAEGVSAEMLLPATLTRFSIGRDPANDWPIPDRTLAISARHCEIVATVAGPALRDLSTNGTFVNGGIARLSGEHALREGDRIEMGPYTVLVQVAGAARAPTPNPAAAPPAPGVEETAPLRGGDPAAMLAGSGGVAARARVTELLRSTPPPDDTGVELTKIRLAPRPAAAASAAKPARAAPAAAAAAAAPSPVQSPARSPAPAIEATGAAQLWLAQLATGLGLAPDALAGRDPAEVATQLGALARAAVTALRELLEQQALERRRIGSRAPALSSMRELSPLRLAATADDALRTLLAPGADAQAALQRAAADLATHQERLMTAFRSAVAWLGEEMAPASLESALAGTGEAEKPARLWELYRRLWQGIGLAPGQPWSMGFLDAALMHLAAAYDEPPNARERQSAPR